MYDGSAWSARGEPAGERTTAGTEEVQTDLYPTDLAVKHTPESVSSQLRFELYSLKEKGLMILLLSVP